MTLDVIAISRSRNVAVLSDGNQAPVSNWFAGDGDDCEPGVALVAIVKGAEDCWIVVDLAAFELPVYH